MSYKLFIFDLDGTLINSGGGIKYALETFEDRLNLSHFPKDEADFIVGPPIAESILRTHPELKDRDIKELTYFFDQCYDEVLLHDTFAYEGIDKVLDLIHEKGGIVTIDTAKIERQATRCLKHGGIYEKIDYMEAWSEEKNNKPLLIAEIIRKYGIEKDQIVTIGDSHFDGEAANANGIDLIAIKYGFGFGKFDDEKQFNAKYVVNSVQELYHLINSIL